MTSKSHTVGMSYQKAGVSIDAGNEFVTQISPLVKKTHRPEVLASIGGFAGLFKLNLTKYKNPVLVSCTDGVGTKLKLALALGQFNTIGVDLVAMSVNDLICCGAEPLFFLDYYATAKLKVAEAKDVITGICDSLGEINCTLLGGETAEMPGMYQAGDFDLAGFAVGVVEEADILTGNNIKPGDAIIGIASSGFHSNGYSLVRRIIQEKALDLEKNHGFSKPLGAMLLEPTKIYVNPILKLLQKKLVKGVAHITGGGLLENVPRILPADVCAVITKNKIPEAPLFSRFQEWGQVAEDEMWRVFNMGVGMVVVTGPNHAGEALKVLNESGFAAWHIGEISGRKNNSIEIH